MRRYTGPELMEDRALPSETLTRVHRDLDRIHRWLGNVDALVRAIQTDARPVRRVLDVGCGWGGTLVRVREKLGVEAIGVDLRPPASAPVPILRADVTRDRLPEADVAFSLYVAHHLDPPALAAMLRNVRRCTRRFILLDLVRHPLPLALYRAFLGPWVHRINRIDGARSVRAAYTAPELRGIAAGALQGEARIRHTVAPFYVRQVLDISFA
ncbi:MAG: methyltransferase domain-containing protein [Bryobacteraceae bacterium]